MESADSARRLLESAGFQQTRARAFEANTVYDTPELSLKRSRRLLRLREFDGENVFTFKGVPVEGTHKTREEIETLVASAAQLHQILTRLGYEPMFRYEKYRTSFARPGDAGVAVLDETPIGVYVELEGAPAWIDETAAQLGLNAEAYITDSYGTLYLKHCEAHGIAPSHMTFAK